MPSTFANTRRRPQQARAALRRAQFLEAAAGIIGDAGYEEATMTAIAEKAGASIGALYDYFPDKQSLAQALLAQYIEEADAHWTVLMSHPSALKKTTLADLFVDGALDFLGKRPAYLPLFGTTVVCSRSNVARQQLRKTFADALQRLNPKKTSASALISAHVIAELIKALFAACKHSAPKDRDEVVGEFKKLMRLYIGEALK
jgi:AcrR family transcriptional regulator